MLKKFVILLEHNMRINILRISKHGYQRNIYF